MTEKQGSEAVPVELLPCPFCGSEARISEYVTESLWSHDQVTYTQVSCGNCDVMFASEPGQEPNSIAAWNQRTFIKRVLYEAQFLVDRIGDLDWCGTIDDLARDWSGHVDPPLYRLREVLAAAPQATPASPVSEAVSTERVKALEAALRPFLKHYEPWMDGKHFRDDMSMGTFARVNFGDLRRARATLGDA